MHTHNLAHAAVSTIFRVSSIEEVGELGKAPPTTFNVEPSHCACHIPILHPKHQTLLLCIRVSIHYTHYFSLFHLQLPNDPGTGECSVPHSPPRASCSFRVDEFGRYKLLCIFGRVLIRVRFVVVFYSHL